IGVRSIDDAEGAIVLDLVLQDRNDVGSHPIAEAREIVSGSRGRDGDRVWELPHRLRQAVPLRLILRLMKLVKECAVHSFAVARYARQRPELCILARLLDSLHFWDQAERTLQFWLPFDDRLRRIVDNATLILAIRCAVHPSADRAWRECEVQADARKQHRLTVPARDLDVCIDESAQISVLMHPPEQVGDDEDLP